MTKKAGSGSRSGPISQRHRSADLDPDPYQNVMDPQQVRQQTFVWTMELEQKRTHSPHDENHADDRS
jgi:hypothetical protein